MAHQFPQSPVQGTISTLTNGRKLQFNGGKWDIFTNTLPQNVQPIYPGSSPVEAAVAPSLPNSNQYWFDTANSIMHYQYNGAWVAIASGSGGGGSSTPVMPLVAASAPALPNSNPFWINSADGVLYVQKVDGATRTWERCSPEVVIPAIPSVDQFIPVEAASAPSLPSSKLYWFNTTTSTLYFQHDGAWVKCKPDQVTTPIEQETPPSLPNSNPFWYKPSTSTLHYQYNDGNSTQWVEV